MSKYAAKRGAPIGERLMGRIAVGDDVDCWPWTGCRNGDGYGTLKVKRGRGSTLAYRRVWEWNNGPVPKGLEVRHVCHQRACCNPLHLTIGTHKENMEDMSLRVRREQAA